MSLNKQIHIYSFDTSAFYTDEEKAIELKRNERFFEKANLKAEKEILSKYFRGALTLDKAQSQYRALYKIKQETPINIEDINRISAIDAEIKQANADIKQLKGELATLLSNHNGVRQLREEYVIDRNVISVFESMLTRTLGIETGKLSDVIMVIRVYFFEVIQDMILNGFTYKGERYVCLTASAGQIRTKKVVFIKERIWKQYQKTLMCGLTVDSINECGGININKYLAYLALCNSATDLWEDFDIRKTIVVDDMETTVSGIVDFIDHRTYITERKQMEVPITHTDGCGMVLPRRSKKNTMVRLPWVKGLLAVFPFDRFIKEADAADPSVSHGKIKDIYGIEHDVLEEDIEVIFTKSQFKMYKYYDSWDEYIKMFLENGCTVGKCNEEESFLPDAKLNYQMLQTLTDISDTELETLAGRSIDKISRIASDRATMLDVFGASSQYSNQNAFQKCLQLYPELLADPYTKDILKQIKKSMVNDAKAAKLAIAGKYMFLIPDLYAFCEWLFLGHKDPTGLLADGEVSSYLYRNVEKLDCLRSPHLYREHAVRRNVVTPMTRKWFTPNAIYTSCHDLISKILQFDCDGDKSLVCADRLLVDIAERNMDGIVPLYYEMAKAGAVTITNDEIFKGLRAAWTGGNIGTISNDITKIWNSGDVDIDAIKILCMENNFCIDYAKTLFKPIRPDSVDIKLAGITGMKPPHFFIYAKQREDGQVQQINNSTVNRLDEIIPNKRMNFSAKNIGRFNYKYMLSERKEKVEVDPEIIALYDECEKQYRYTFNTRDDGDENSGYVRGLILSAMQKTQYSLSECCDMLIKYLFKDTKSKRKNVFWLCFGDIVLQNLGRNLPTGSKQCIKCGGRFVPKNPQQRICSKCHAPQPVHKKVSWCIDCGKQFEVDGIVKNKKRCDVCQAEHQRFLTRERVKRHRNIA